MRLLGSLLKGTYFISSFILPAEEADEWLGPSSRGGPWGITKSDS